VLLNIAWGVSATSKKQPWRKRNKGTGNAKRGKMEPLCITFFLLALRNQNLKPLYIFPIAYVKRKGKSKGRRQKSIGTRRANVSPRDPPQAYVLRVSRSSEVKIQGKKINGVVLRDQINQPCRKQRGIKPACE